MPKISCEKCNELARLLIECRDALPAIDQWKLRIYHISPTLADRIDVSLKPWEVHPGEDGYESAI